MFANLLQLIPPRRKPGFDDAFVKEVRVRSKPVRNPKVERFILICWILIAIKQFAVLYACSHWPVPFNALWINGPTLALGLLATGVYYWRH